jgi:Uncharacterized protein conserved in bacteria
MKIDAAFVTAHLRYSHWASGQMLQAARELGREELHRHLYSSYPSVHATLLHIFRADRIWITRLAAEPVSAFAQPGEDSLSLDDLERQWQAVNDRFIAWSSGVSDERIDGMLEWVNLRGEKHATPVWQIVMHVVNHASYHRGQIATMLRQLGHVPPNTDLHYFPLYKSS